MQPARIPSQPQRLSRRAFLCGLATTVTGALLVACGPPRSTNRAEVAFGPEATPQIILPSPMPPTTPMPAQETPLLTEFLALSALLTGVPNLSPTLGQSYLQSVQGSDESGFTIAQLIAQAGFGGATPPDSLAVLEATGLFAQKPARQLADRITEMWYTGVYINDQGEEAVATYADALAWQTLAFTKPMTICGYPGFWSEAWEAVLD
jgi:hypothetical protein